MSAYTKSEVKQIQENYDFWLQFEHDQWKLISFNDKISARFGWEFSGQYTKYAEIKVTEVRFLRGVDPDVLDQL